MSRRWSTPTSTSGCRSWAPGRWPRRPRPGLISPTCVPDRPASPEAGHPGASRWLHGPGAKLKGPQIEASLMLSTARRPFILLLALAACAAPLAAQARKPPARARPAAQPEKPPEALADSTLAEVPAGF